MARHICDCSMPNIALVARELSTHFFLPPLLRYIYIYIYIYIFKINISVLESSPEQDKSPCRVNGCPSLHVL